MNIESIDSSLSEYTSCRRDNNSIGHREITQPCRLLNDKYITFLIQNRLIKKMGIKNHTHMMLYLFYCVFLPIITWQHILYFERHCKQK